MPCMYYAAACVLRDSLSVTACAMTILPSFLQSWTDVHR